MSKRSTSELKINTRIIKKAAMILRAINHPLRLTILQLLHKKQRMAVTDIYNKLGLIQSVTSQHLSILRKAGFVITEREGQFIYYSVNYKRISEIQDYSNNLIKLDAASMVYA